MTAMIPFLFKGVHIPHTLGGSTARLNLGVAP